MPGMGDLWAMMQDTLREILPEILGDRTAREAPPRSPILLGPCWGECHQGMLCRACRLLHLGKQDRATLWQSTPKPLRLNWVLRP